jgi:hypothetical protein
MGVLQISLCQENQHIDDINKFLEKCKHKNWGEIVKKSH